MTEVFSRELEKGSGLPVILLQKQVITAGKLVDEILLEHIFENKAFDPQSEGSRHRYLFRVVANYAHKEKIYAQVIEKFTNMSGNDYGEAQIFGFVTELVKIGLFPKKGLYDKFDFYCARADSDAIPGIEHLLELDGITGAIHVAEKLGQLIDEKEPWFFSDDPVLELYDSANLRYEKISGALQLSKNPCIQKYVRLYAGKSSKPPPERKTIAELLVCIRNKQRFPLRNWLKKATADEKASLAKLFTETADEDIKCHIILQFNEIKIDLPFDTLYEEFLKTNNVHYRLALLESMLPFRNSALKKIAGELISDDYLVVKLKILVAFYEDENEWQLREYLQSLNRFTCHELQDFILHNDHIQKYAIFRTILYQLLEVNTCSICRASLFNKLCEHDFIDQNMCAAGFFDANEQIVERAKSYYREKFSPQLPAGRC